MTSKLTLDKAGRIVIPKPLREELHLSSGDSLEILSRGNELVLRPCYDEPTMFKEDGMWVIKTGKSLATEEISAAIDAGREERHQQIIESFLR